MFLKNQKGFSLAEVLVATGILGVLSLAINQLIFTQNKSVKTVEKKFEVSALTSTIRTILSDREACHNTFGISAGPPPSGTYDPNDIPAGTITEIRNKNNDVIFTSNLDPALAPKVGNGKISILSFSLSSADVAPIPADSTGISNFAIEYHRGKNIHGTETISKIIQLNTRTDAGTTMIDCGTTAVNDVIVNTTSLCDAIGGTYDVNGRAGVGDCHTLSPNNDTTFNGNIIVNGTSTLNGDTAVNGLTTLVGDVSVTGNLTVDDTFGIELLSDRSLKYDISPIESPLDKINLIDTVEFKWRRNSQKDIGFIAQNVEHVFPSLVSKTKKGLLAVKYPNMVAVALSGIKDQQEQIHQLKSNMELMKKENKRLNEQLSSIRELLCKDKSNSKLCD